MSVELCISCVVKGYHHCLFKVKEGEPFLFPRRGEEVVTHLINQTELGSPLWPRQVDISAFVCKPRSKTVGRII